MSTSVDASIHFYDSLWSRTKRTDQHHKCRMHAIARLLDLLPRTEGHTRGILELGCGSGIVSEFLARYGNVTGVDQSSVGIETARARGCGRFLISVLPTIPSEATEFDLCVLSQVVEHFTDSDRVTLLRNARDAVRPGGHLVVTTPNRPVASRIRLRPGEAEPIENWLDPAELHTLLRATGWEPLKTRFAFSFLPISSSRYRWVRALRFAAYDVLRLRNVVEDLTGGWGVGDCTAVLAARVNT
jgi:SAM-dependent methyltransferase